ncbi:MAG: peptidoglycan -binding protein [Alphaproteobacteria bacterium]|nr:peptidoglycan -binding protein [Alphaproteobacteria bacterium]
MYTRNHRQKGVNLDVWPGYVDALATLLIVMIFALMIFVVSQVYLSDALQGSKRGLESLEAKLREIANLLQVEQKKNVDLTETYKTTLNQLSELETKKKQMETEFSQKLSSSSMDLEQQQQLSHKAEAELTLLRQQIEELNQKLQNISGSLEVAEATATQQKIIIDDLDKKLSAALAQKVEELEKYRSEFFGKLKELLANRADIRIVGDRFVFQSEVLFPSASATLGAEGEVKLKQLAGTLQEIAAKMPKDLNWVLRIDGHTDNIPIHTDKFDSNWELSAARAISVIKFLIKEGIRPEHLAAAGFGEFYPIEKGVDGARNRRIELKLDQR